MSSYDYDLIVIGAGSGGVRAARMSAGFGARVAVCEESRLGGTCVNLGCIPKKLFVYGAHFAEEIEDARGYGWTVTDARFDWPTLVANKDKEIERLNGVYRRILENAGVDIVEGRARVVDPHAVEVGGRRLTAARILVASGSRPFLPPFSGHEWVITSSEFFHLEALPKRAVVLGGGYIAVELAGVLAGLGVQVTLCYRGRLFLRGFDDDVRHFLADEMRKKGVDLRFHHIVRHVEKKDPARQDSALVVSLEDGTHIETDAVLAATGRVPNTEGLGLEEVGVKLTDRGAIAVDEELRTSVPSIFALGDVIDRMQLTPVALAEAMAFARAQFGGAPQLVDYDNVPTAVFSQPSVGTVGLTEAAARQRYPRVAVYKSTFTPLKHTLTGRGEKTFMKLVVDKDSDLVLGCHMVGPDAGEIIQGFAVALRCGATKAQLDATIGIHPTAAEEFVTMRTPEPEPELPKVEDPLVA